LSNRIFADVAATANEASLFEVTESCATLRQAGHFATGYYLTSAPGSNHIDVTYCNMKMEVDEDGFQIDTLTRLPKTMVAFDAYRVTSFTAFREVIPYEAFEMQIGGGMDLLTGVFTAPVAGIYTFTGTWSDYDTEIYSWLWIRKNGREIAAAYSSETDWNSFGMTVMVSLAEGDTVDTYLYSGYVMSYEPAYTRFSGHLIYPM
jgi:hypothetical protein